MAAKLTVVISQSAQRSPAMVELEESLLTQVMLSPDLDAVLIGALEGLTADSTDALCLSMLPKDFVMLGWLAIDTATNCLQQAKLHWQLADSVVGRADVVRYLRLSAGQDPNEILVSLQQIHKNLSVKTLQISITPTVKRTSTPPTLPLDSKLTVVPVRLDTSVASGPTSMEPVEQELPVEEDKLDRLLDELDSLNL